MAVAPCRLLEWDSAFFELRIARVNEPLRTEREALSALDWSLSHRIQCLYYLAPSDDSRVSAVANKFAFSLVDIRMTLGNAHQTAIPPFARVRCATEKDLPALIAIARSAHTDSRFYYDGNFSRERCDDLYELWITKTVHGDAQRVFVVEQNGHPAGYVTCHVNGENGEIGLLGIAEGARRTGCGTELVGAALNFFKMSGIERVRVVTQGRNFPAQRLYQRCGFLTQSVELWFHRWFSTPSQIS